MELADDIVKIGCISLTTHEWLEKGKEIGEEYNLTDKEMEEYMGYIKIIKERR